MFKILLLGTNKAVIDDLFNQLGEVFEVLTSSLRYEDVMCHIKYVKPDAILYCLKNENKDVPGGPVVKNLPCNVGDMGLIPGGELRSQKSQSNKPTCRNC